jgi:hypothetical protein
MKLRSTSGEIAIATAGQEARAWRVAGKNNSNFLVQRA